MIQSLLYSFTKKWDYWIEKLFLSLSFLLLLCTFISAMNAFVRKITGYSANSWLELQWILFSAVFMLGAAGLLRHDGHIRIDIFYQKFSKITQKRINLCAYLGLCVPFFSLIAYYTIPFWFSSFVPVNPDHSWIYYLLVDTSFFETSSNAGGLSTPFAKMILPVGFILLAIQSLNESLKIMFDLCIIKIPNNTHIAYGEYSIKNG